MKKWMCCLAGCLLAYSLFAGGDDDREAHGLAWEAKLRGLLEEARTNDLVEVMNRNKAVFAPISFVSDRDTAEVPQYLTRYPNRWLALQLEVLQVVYDALDKDYDADNPPYMFVDSIAASPDDFDTPEEWEALRKRRAENKWRIQKHSREMYLKEYYTSLLRIIQTRLTEKKVYTAALEDSKFIQRLSPEEKEQFTAGGDEVLRQRIGKHITAPDLYRIVFSNFLAKAEEKKPAAENTGRQK